MENNSDINKFELERMLDRFIEAGADDLSSLSDLFPKIKCSLTCRNIDLNPFKGTDQTFDDDIQTIVSNLIRRNNEYAN